MHSAVKTLEKEVNERLGVQPIYSTRAVLNLNGYQNEAGYDCVIHVGNNEFSNRNNKPPPSERSATELAAKNAYVGLCKLNWKLPGTGKKGKYKDKKSEVDKTIHLGPSANTTKEGWWCLKNMGGSEIYNFSKYVSKDMLATLFRDLVLLVVKRSDYNAQYKYTTRLCREGGVIGYISELELNGRKFESLGLMVDENQAMQSASEICLRTLGILPNVKSDDLVIQPYQGGLSFHHKNIKLEKQHIFTDTLFTDLLEAFLESRNIPQGKYSVNGVECERPPEFSVNGEVEEVVECVLMVDGKLFRSPHQLIARIAMQFAAKEALEYFGIHRVQQRMELRKNIHVHRHDFWKHTKSIYHYRPSVHKGWVWSRYCPPTSYGDEDIVALLNSKVLLNNLPDVEYTQELIREEMEGAPSFNNKPFWEISDITVGEVDAVNPNIFVVGNSHFSIRLLCECGMIYSKQRKAMVEVLPGHNIQKLKCKYRVSLPSLEIHLKAIDCYDLYYSNPPLPVVTSCGVVLLSHDFVESRDNIFVLVRRRLSGSTFESKIHAFHALLQKLIQPNFTGEITPVACTEGIENWLHEEVKLLSEMGMESLCKLMSTCMVYDTRWNELFAKGELPQELQEIQEICLNEMKRREDAGLPLSDELIWELPQSQFVNTFDSIGIHIESSILCGMRTIADTAGVKVHLGDMEKAATVDVAVDKDDKLHRGDVHRFYIWDDVCRGKPKKDPTKEITQGYQHKKRKFEHGRRRYFYGSSIQTRTNVAFRNITYLNEDGTRTDVIAKFNNKTAKLSITKELKAEEEEGKVDKLVECSTEDEKKEFDENPEELPKIPIPGDADFVCSTASLAEFCRIKKLGRPTYKKRKKDLGDGKIAFYGTVAFGKYFFRTKDASEDRKSVSLHSAEEALRGLGYIKSSDVPKQHADIHLPGDEKFSSFKGSLQMLGCRENGCQPKYSVKQEGELYRAAVVVGKTRLVTKELYSSPKEATTHAAYEVLQKYGYLDGVAFEAGYKRTVAKKPSASEDAIETNEKATSDVHDEIDADTTNDEAIIDDQVDIDADVTNDEAIANDQVDIDPYSIVDEATVTRVDQTATGYTWEPHNDTEGSEEGEKVEEDSGIIEANDVELDEKPSEEVGECCNGDTEDVQHEFVDEASESIEGNEGLDETHGFIHDHGEEHFETSEPIEDEGEEHYETSEHIDDGGELDELSEAIDHRGEELDEPSEAIDHQGEELDEPSEPIDHQGDGETAEFGDEIEVNVAADESEECMEEESNNAYYKDLTSNEWARDDDINLASDDEDEPAIDTKVEVEVEEKEKEKEVPAAPAAPSVNQWLEDEDICTADMDFNTKRGKNRKSWIDVNTGKRFRKSTYTTFKQRQARREALSGGKEVVPVQQHCMERDDIERSWIKDDVQAKRKKQPLKRKAGFADPTWTPAVKKGKQNNAPVPLMSTPTQPPPTDNQKWLQHLPKNSLPVGKRKKLAQWEKVPSLPARDAFREQCLWMPLEEAIEVCPMLKKVAETSQFQHQLKRLIGDANEFLKSKGFEETAKSSLLSLDV